jgi:hypothetical protein
MNAPNQDDPEVKQLSVIKSNLGAFPEPIGFMIDEEGVEFCEPPAPQKQENLSGKVEEQILLLLATHGNSCQADTIYESVEALGVSRKTAKRIKKRLGISSYRKDGKWFWTLSE